MLVWNALILTSFSKGLTFIRTKNGKSMQSKSYNIRALCFSWVKSNLKFSKSGNIKKTVKGLSVGVTVSTFKICNPHPTLSYHSHALITFWQLKLQMCHTKFTQNLHTKGKEKTSQKKFRRRGYFSLKLFSSDCWRSRCVDVSGENSISNFYFLDNVRDSTRGLRRIEF